MTGEKQRSFLIYKTQTEIFNDFMNGSEYRAITYVHSQKRIRGAVWRLVRRSVQDALYGLSDVLKATVTGKVEGWDVAEGELGVGVRGAGLDVMDVFF